MESNMKNKMSPLCVLLLALFSLINCGYSEEVSRETSPDRALEAVIIRENRGGATVGFVCKVFIRRVNSGGRGILAATLSCFHSRSNTAIIVKWAGNRELLIRHEPAVVDDMSKELKIDDGKHRATVKVEFRMNDPNEPLPADWPKDSD
jgi:hypothetical protein